jgi:ABC-2 type transport system permease protein
MKMQPVFASMWRREVLNFRRYAFNTISSLITIYLAFCMVLFGYKAIVGPSAAKGGTLEGLVVAYFVWTLSFTSYSSLSWSMVLEAQVGTLEQLYLSPAGFRAVSAFTSASNFVVQLAFSAAALILAMLTAGKPLHLDVVSVIPLVVLMILGVYGIGYILGGLALVFKRIQGLFQIMQFIFACFMFAPVKFVWAKLLPLTMGNHLVARVMVDGRRIWELSLVDLGYLIASSALYLGLGLLVFSCCERVAKGRGLLSHY